MIQRTFELSSPDEISRIAEQIREQPLCASAKCKVLFAWTRQWEEEGFASFRQTILESFPDFTIIGTNYHSRSDILNSGVDPAESERGCILSFLLFENAGATLYGISTDYGEEEREGLELKKLIMDTNDPRGVYLIPHEYANCMEDVLKEIGDIRDVPVFGLKTSMQRGYRSFGFEPGRGVMEDCLLVLIFHGRQLNIRVHYNLGWTPVGKPMTVTKEENPFLVDEIDGKAASFVYNKYLGLRNEQIMPQNLSEFPLIIDRNGVKISRIGINGPGAGQLIFGAPVYPGDRISLSYGNPDDLFDEIRRDNADIADFGAQAGLLIVCVNRVMLLRERETDEIELYRKQVNEVAAVYGYGELFYLNGRGGELNSALVSVVFREDGPAAIPGCTDEADKASKSGTPEASAEESEFESTDSADSLFVPFQDRLSRLFKEMSGDLIMAVEEAKNANRSKSVFFSSVSHEFRTPLNSILGMNDMILRECTDGNILKYARNIKSSGRLLQELINDILDTGRIEAGKMEIIPVDYKVREVMDELAAMIDYSAGEKGLIFNYSVDEGLPVILHGDEKRIRQCIINLLNNAVKYTTKGVVAFSVGSSPVDKTHAKLHISVRDSGIGIRPEDIEKLSVPYERVDGSKNYNVEGTGLGLNIVKNLLALMGSKLEIRSNYGRGSVFSFDIVQEIPLMADGSVKKEIVDTSADRSSESLKTQNATILVVDDTPVNIELVKLFLKDSGIIVDMALDGDTALTMAADKKYDIIFIDRRMPGMDGFELHRRIKADTAGVNAGSVFVLLTADESDSIREQALAEGFTDYLSKPFDSSALEKILRKHLPKETRVV